MKAQLYRNRRRRERRRPEVSLTPLIDTALTLLIIFMITTPMLKKENALEVELPKGNVKEVSDGLQQELVVSVDKQGRISFDGKLLSQKDLITVLQKKVGEHSKKTVFVKADTTVHYGIVIELVDAIKHIGGIKYVALATEKISEKSTSSH